jgi:hypothetical protein
LVVRRDSGGPAVCRIAVRWLPDSLGGRYVQYGEFLADEADVPVAFVEAALDCDDTVRHQRLPDQGVGVGEVQDFHLAVAVCEVDDCPGLARFGRLALDVGDEAGECDDAFGAAGCGEFGDGGGPVAGQDVLGAVQRVRGDIHAEHVPLGCPELPARPLCVVDGEVEAGRRLVVVGAAKAAEEVVLSDRGLLVDRDDRVDGVFVDGGQPFAGGSRQYVRARGVRC